jgi:DDE_Tnp_1-like zinc-ribbon
MFNEVEKEGEQDEEEEANLQPEFAKLPMNRKMNMQQIKQFKSIIDTKRKLYKVFNSGLPKKVRLEPTYRHIMVDAEKQGRCVFCLSEKKINWPKFKCKTCGVYLCRTPKEGGRLSCVEKWHSKQDLFKSK